MRKKEGRDPDRFWLWIRGIDDFVSVVNLLLADATNSLPGA